MILNTFERVRLILVELLGVESEKVNMDSDFIDDLGADSLDVVELVMAAEEEFGIEIPDDDAETLTTVLAAVEYLNKKTGIIDTGKVLTYPDDGGLKEPVRPFEHTLSGFEVIRDHFGPTPEMVEAANKAAERTAANLEARSEELTQAIREGIAEGERATWPVWDEKLRGPQMSNTRGRTIHKYQMPVKERFTLLLPEGAQILRVEDQDGFFWMWALINTEAPLKKRHFIAVKTGGTIPEDAIGLLYLGFCKIFIQMELGLYIFEEFLNG